MRPCKLALASTAVVLALALTGCSSSGAGSASDSQTPAPTSAPATSQPSLSISPTASPTPAGTDQALVPPTTVVTPVATTAPVLADTNPPASPNPAVESIAPSDEPAIANTTWTGSTTYRDRAPTDTKLGFSSDGNLAFIDNGQAVPGITWSRTGNKINISFDSGYATEQGEIDGNTIRTTGRSPADTWTAVYTKQQS